MKNFGKTTDIKDIITVEYEADNAVLYSTSQSLTNNQKVQARTNIGAGTSSFDGNYNSLSNKPTIPTKTSQLNNDSNFATTSQVEAKYTKPADGIPKTDLATAVQNSLTAADNAVKYTSQSLTDAQKVQARANIGAGTSNFSGSYNDLTNRPTIPAAVSIVQSTGTSTSSVMSQKATTDAVNGKLSKTDNTNIEVLGTKKATTTLGGNQLYAPNGVIFGGSAAAAGLVTRGICGVSTPSVGGACTKENLYINYDGNNDFNVGRQIVLNAGTTGNHLGSNMYQYTVPRGDIVKNWVEAKGYATSVKVNGNTIASSGGVVDIGTVVTDVSDKQDKITSSNKLSASLVSGLAKVATSGSYNDLSNKPKFVSSVNGSSGAITNVAKTDETNVFTPTQMFPKSSDETQVTLLGYSGLSAFSHWVQGSLSEPRTGIGYKNSGIRVFNGTTETPTQHYDVTMPPQAGQLVTNTFAKFTGETSGIGHPYRVFEDEEAYVAYQSNPQNVKYTSQTYTAFIANTDVNSRTVLTDGRIDNKKNGTKYELTFPTKTGTLALTSDVSEKLDKTTYEVNKTIEFGRDGALCIGKFKVYDTNVTCEITSTTSVTYSGKLVIATQNYVIKQMTVYGDAANTVTSNIYIKPSSASDPYIEVYFKPASWSKNVVHIYGSAIAAEPTNVCTNVSAVPSTATEKPVNALTYLAAGDGGYSLNASGYVKGSWLQSSAISNKGANTGKVCVFDDNGWIYYRTPAEILTEADGVKASDVPTALSELDDDINVIKKASTTTNSNAWVFSCKGNLISSNSNADYCVALGSGCVTNYKKSIKIGNAYGSTPNNQSVTQIGAGNYSSSGRALYLGAGDSGFTYMNSAGSSWSSASDIRDKTDIQNIDHALDFIKKLKPITYVMNEREKYLIKDEEDNPILDENGKQQYDIEAHKRGDKKKHRRFAGLSAQDTYQAMLDCYNNDTNYAQIVDNNKFDHPDDEYLEQYSMSYERLVPFLIKAVQEQQEQIDKLKSKLGE